MPESDKKLEKIGIFIDVQNIYYTCRQAYQANFDYNKFWAKVTKDREVVCAYAYATDRGDQKQAQFQNILRAIGFEVKLKAVLKRLDGTSKADWDVGIALDVFEAAQSCDTIVLASGDGLGHGAGIVGIVYSRLARFGTQIHDLVPPRLHCLCDRDL